MMAHVPGCLVLAKLLISTVATGVQVPGLSCTQVKLNRNPHISERHWGENQMLRSRVPTLESQLQAWSDHCQCCWCKAVASWEPEPCKQRNWQTGGPLQM